uniref:Ropporin-1-like protein n=1 Tax=Lygus hesperus TaxID=30085 RepID=A0A0A9XEJ4_LYGHE
MPDLVEQMYCSQQIFIPPNLPSILKKYAKAAIRTQPGDLLAWSSAYFRALAEGIPPPAKDRIEYPPVDTPSGLSPGFLKVLINQIGKRETVQKDVLAERWKGVCLNPKALQDLLDVGMFEDDVSWLEFLAICVGTLEPSLTRTMIELCELLTEEPEGGRASIPVTIFLNLYKYLAKLDCGPINRLEQYEQTLIPDTETQCQATDLEPTEGEKEPEDVNIDWDTAIDALKGRDSDFSVNTKGSDDGMMVWPDIKPQEKEEVDPEPVLEKEVTSEDGIEEPQEEEQIEGVSEQEENIFAPQIDSFTDLLEAESAPVEETNQEQLAAALQSTELAAEDMAGVIMAIEGVESTAEEGALQGSPEPGTVPLPDGKGENQDQKKEPRRPKKDVEIESLVKKDSDMMLLPTPITSDIMLYMDGVCDKTGVKLCQSQQLHPKMSMIDVQVSVPVDETVVEVFEHHRYPKWMHIPGIGPTVPDHLIEEVEKYFLKIAELQEGMVMPRNIKHFHCPPLELIPECPEGIAEGL